MIVVMTKFPVKPEHKEAYAEHLKASVSRHSVEEQPGFEDMRLLAPHPSPHGGENNMFIIETTWLDMPSFLAYTQSDAFKKSHENMPPHDWFAGRPSVEIYETID
jgi:heme-degrading monooxygenase HmoA